MKRAWLWRHEVAELWVGGGWEKWLHAMLHPRTLGGLTSRALIYLADLAFSCTPPLSLSTTGIASSRITRSYATLYSLDWLLVFSCDSFYILWLQ